jgi:hypothetical protein
MHSLGQRPTVMIVDRYLVVDKVTIHNDCRAPGRAGVVTEEMLAELPEPVRPQRKSALP